MTERMASFEQGMDITPWVVVVDTWVNGKADIICRAVYDDITVDIFEQDWWFIYDGNRLELDGMSQAGGFVVLLTYMDD